jgi:hypothetical protein
MSLYVVPRPNPEAQRTPRDADELDDTLPDATLVGPLDVDENEDTQPAATLEFPQDFWDAPTIPDLSMPAPDADAGSWQRVLRAVAEAVRDVLPDRHR